jgi:hypothetical protein
MITICTIKSLGILGVVLGKSLGSCVAQIMPQLMIKYRSGYAIRISKAYFAGIIVAFCLGLIQVVWSPNAMISILFGIIGWISFLIGGKFNIHDFQSMLNMIFKK